MVTGMSPVGVNLTGGRIVALDTSVVRQQLVLRSGQTLVARVVTAEPSGQATVSVAGKTVPAQLPPGLPAGAQLQLVVRGGAAGRLHLQVVQAVSASGEPLLTRQAASDPKQAARELSGQLIVSRDGTLARLAVAVARAAVDPPAPYRGAWARRAGGKDEAHDGSAASRPSAGAAAHTSAPAAHGGAAGRTVRGGAPAPAEQGSGRPRPSGQSAHANPGPANAAPASPSPHSSDAPSPHTEALSEAVTSMAAKLVETAGRLADAPAADATPAPAATTADSALAADVAETAAAAAAAAVQATDTAGAVSAGDLPWVVLADGTRAQVAVYRDDGAGGQDADGVPAARVVVHGQRLGAVELELRLTAGTVSVVVRADEAACDALRQRAGALQAALSGCTAHSAHVSVVARRRGTAAPAAPGGFEAYG